MENAAVSTENIAGLQARIIELEALVKYYEELFRLSKHRQFDASSEKSEYDQLSLFNEAEVTAETTIPEPEIEEVKSYHRKKAKTSVDRLPPDLPVEVITHTLPEDKRICPECNGPLHVMGHETRDELKVIPAKVVILRHVRDIFACYDCEGNNDHVPIIKADMPEPVIKGSFASPESVAYIASQKFVMGIPLYRQEQEWERQGILLSRQTMSNWLCKATESWIKPIYDRMRELLIASEVLHADETTVQVLQEPNKKAQSKSYMWLYRTSGDVEHAVVLYEYKPSRSGEHPATFLRDYKGYLHTDGYDGYHSKLPSGITVVGCWAHCRRKFDEALKILPEKERIGSGALHGKNLCDQLFALERKFAGLPPDDHFKARFEARSEESKKIMDEFFTWCENAGALPKSALGKAVQYALDQRKWLNNVLLDGRLELSNNRAERSIKPFVIGRKNWIFNKTPKGADVSAMLYSVVETAKENGLNPYDYLTQVFRDAPNLPSGTSVDGLLPWNTEKGV